MKLIKKLMVASLLITALSLLNVKAEEAGESFIADRVIRGLVFTSDNNESYEIPDRIQKEIKARTGITLEIDTVVVENSISALASEMNNRQLPDFIAYGLQHSGETVASVFFESANEGLFLDVAPLLAHENLQVFNRYLEADYLSTDSRENIMFRPEWEGASYLIHMEIPRDDSVVRISRQSQPYIRKDIAESLGIEPKEISTSEEVLEVAQAIKAGDFTNSINEPVIPIGPTEWGGQERLGLFHDLYWTFDSGELFYDGQGEIQHESQTDTAMKRVEFIQKLHQEELIEEDYFAKSASETIDNIQLGTYGIITEMTNNSQYNQNGTYIPFGAPIKRLDGSNNPVERYKQGYHIIALSAETEEPEQVLAFADWMASKEGKLLGIYGIEGEDYELNDQGFPEINDEVYELFLNNPEEAYKLGFAGVGNKWHSFLGNTDINNVEDFGEPYWGAIRQGVDEEAIKESQKRDLVDGVSIRSFLYDFEGYDGQLVKSLDKYYLDLQVMYAADSLEAAEEVLALAQEDLEDSGLFDFIEFVEKQLNNGVEILY